ncbi:MAG: S1 RNA-binding domain-containing protein [Thiohalomonadales bacterium]
MITIGKTYSLNVVKSVHFGFYLDAKNLGEVLLPLKYAPFDLSIGDSLRIFLYLDSEDRPIATTKRPKAEVGQFAYLQVLASTDVGLFLDWGLDKDLLVPFSEQHRPMQVGQFYLVYLYLDNLDGRVTASSKIEKFLDDERPHNFEPRQAVDLIIANSTDLGYKAIINHSHWGVLYKNEVYQRLSFGQSIKGFIKNIRPDRKIDLSLDGGQETRDKHEQLVLDLLKKGNGYSTLHDRSDSKLILTLLGMSKGSFKKAIGRLYKQKCIIIEKSGIRLVDR